jgi:mycothiol system anti-sigma-R factor
MISCSEAVKQLWDYVEGEVTDERKALIEEHLGVCRRCCGEIEFTEELRRFLSSHAPEDIPQDVRTRLVTYLGEL